MRCYFLHLEVRTWRSAELFTAVLAEESAHAPEQPHAQGERNCAQSDDYYGLHGGEYIICPSEGIEKKYNFSIAGGSHL